jgi:hypothetical protein
MSYTLIVLYYLPQVFKVNGHFKADELCPMWSMIILVMEKNPRIEQRKDNSRSFVLDSVILMFVVVTLASLAVLAFPVCE